MSSRTFILNHSKARNRALEAVKQAPDGYAVKVGEPTRSLEANAAMWPILDAFAKQKQWPVNGKLEWISSEEYKDILTQGLDGGVVMLGKRTSKFSKKRFSEWLEFLHATAAQFGIDTKY
jgi:hypothetical protein